MKILLLLALISFSSISQSNDVNFSGSVYQTFVKSNGNNYFADNSTEGSFKRRNALLNANYSINETFRLYDCFQNKKYTTVTVDGYGDKRYSESIVFGKTLSSKLENYTKEQLFRYICKIRAKKTKGEVEEVNKITLNEVIKCSKYELFKKIQFIRHHNVLEEYT